MASKYSLAAQRPGPYLFSHAITLTSETGVGSTTTIDSLRVHFGPLRWRYVSGGSIMRMFAESVGMSIDEFAAHNREHPEEKWDLKCDDAIRQFGRQNYTVIEGRLPHVFATRSFHIKLVCDLGIRAKRRFGDRKDTTLEGVTAEMALRDTNDNERYEKLYPECLWPLDDFDLVVDTGVCTPAETIEKILAAHGEWRTRHRSNLSEHLVF